MCIVVIVVVVVVIVVVDSVVVGEDDVWCMISSSCHEINCDMLILCISFPFSLSLVYIFTRNFCKMR